MATRAELAERTRTDILDAAMRIMAKRGYAQTRLEDVAEEIGVTRGAIYGHFPNKARLYEAILRCSQEPLYQLLDAALTDDGPAHEVIYRFMLGWLRLLERDPRHRSSTEIFLNKSEMIDEVVVVYEREVQLTKDMVSGMTSIVRRGVRDGDLADDLNPRRCGIQIYGHLMGLMQTWLFNPNLFSLQANAAPMIRQFVDGVLSPKSDLALSPVGPTVME